MPFLRPRFLSLSALVLTLCLSPLPMMAQGLMASELWADWQDGVARRGGMLSAEQKRAGNKLLLTNVRFEPIRDAGVFEIEEVALINQADGSVVVVLPETFPVVVGLPPVTPEAQPREVLLSLNAPQMKVIVRGVGDRADFQIDASELTLQFEKFLPEAPQEAAEPEVIGSLRGVSLRFLQDLSLEAPIVDSALSFESFDLVSDLTSIVEGKTRLERKSLRVDAFEGSFSGAFPASFAPVWAAVTGADQGEGGGQLPSAAAGEAQAPLAPEQAPEAAPETDPAAQRLALPPALLKALDDGFRLSLTLRHGPVSIISEHFEDGLSQSRLDFAALEGTSALTADAASLGLDLGLNGLLLAEAHAQGAEGEAAVSAGEEAGASSEAGSEVEADRQSKLRLSEFRIATALGVNGLTAPQDWRLAATLRDANLSPHLWSLLDPSGRLPQDPLSLVLQLSGRFGVASKALAAEGAGDFVLDMLSLRLDEMLLAAFGVEVTGKGGLDFAFAPEGGGGMHPSPRGRLSLTTSGSEAVLERLEGEGRLSAEEIRALRLQLSMLTRAGEGDDRLVTDLDFREDGGFLNGEKIGETP